MAGGSMSCDRSGSRLESCGGRVGPRTSNGAGKKSPPPGCGPHGGQRGARRCRRPDAGPRHLVRVGQDRRCRVPRPQQGRGQLRGRGLPDGHRPADGRCRPAADGRPPHLRRVSESDGLVNRCHETDLRAAARCAPASVFGHPRGHPERVASRRSPGRTGRAVVATRGRLWPGGDLMSEEVVSELMRAHVYRLASTGQRVDGRGLDQPRPVTVNRAFVKTAEGSARVKLGNTDVLVGIKMSVGEPYPDTPNTGVLSTSVELIPMASPTFEAGPPRPDAIELARVVDRGVRESKMVNMERLCITPKEKVWILFIHIHLLHFHGNLFRPCSYGAVAALASAVAPAKSQGLGDDFPLPVEHWPVSVTTAKIKDLLLVDPSLDEERMADARLTVTTDENGDIRAMQKGLSGSFTYEEVKRIIETAQRVGRDIRPLLQSS